MKIKILTILSLAIFVGLAGCRSASNTNVNTNTNMNMNANMATPTATPAAADTAAQKAVEDALKKKGITGVTVDATTEAVTLRGTVAKGKMTEAVMEAQQAGKRKVVNQLTESK